MKIAIYTQFFYPEPIAKMLPFALDLLRRGHDVRVITGFPNYPGGVVYKGYRNILPQTDYVHGLPVLRVPLYASHDESSLRRMLNYASFAVTSAPFLWGKWRPDVIYVYNQVTIGAVAALCRLTRGIPYVLDVQDVWPDSIVTAGMGGSWLTKPVGRVCDFVYRHASRVTALSPGMRDLLVSRGVPYNKLRVIYNWCDEKATLPENAADVHGLEGLGTGTFNIVYVGNIGAVQGLGAVIESARLVWRKNTKIRFVFLGAGVELGNIRALAAERSPENTVFLPARPLQEALKVQRSADVLLVHLMRCPLFKVTIPSKTQVSLAVGRPILMAVEGDAATLVERGRAGICCEPENPQSISEAALRFASMSVEELGLFSERGAAFYRKELCQEIGVDRFEETLREAAGQL